MKRATAGGSFEEAKEYAFLLLKFRQRSEKELFLRLKKKKFKEEAIEQTLSFLKKRRFVDDGSFARAWINWRLKKPYGLRRIKQELEIKGVNAKTTEGILEEVKKGYREEKIVKKIACSKLDKLKGIEPKKARQRVYSYLLRRGFSPAVIIETINSL